MNAEFFSIMDHTDITVPTEILTPAQILGDLMNTKTNGNSISRIYGTNLPEGHRVYAYNFKTGEVELDEIVSIEQISGDHQQCELSTYKTVPVVMSDSDRIACVDRTAGYRFKYSNTKDLLNTKGLAVLQVENYMRRNETEELIIPIQNEENGIVLNFDSGLLIGHWLGAGIIESNMDDEYVVFYPKSEDDMNIIKSILESMFPDNIDDIWASNRGKNKIKVSFDNPNFTDWLRNTHGERDTKEIPLTYYSVSADFISGLFYGLMMSTGRYSMNDRKKVMYYTFSSSSEMLIRQIIELLNIYASVHANLTSFIVEKDEKERKLFLANIRVTEDVLNNLDIGSFVGDELDLDYIPKTNRHTLKSDDNIIVVTRMTVKRVDKLENDYILYLKNNSSIICTSGLVHQARCSS